MLDVDDYEEYYDKAYAITKKSKRSPLQLVKQYLNNWGYYERNVRTLEIFEMDKAKALFASLKHLTKDERKFLAAKYRVVILGKQAKTDEQVFDNYNMSKYRYRKLRIGIECKLFCHLVDYSETVKNIVN